MKKVAKKLELNKKSIAALNNVQASEIKGGDSWWILCHLLGSNTCIPQKQTGTICIENSVESFCICCYEANA